ncbi:vWA domain-containing protein [Sphingomonas sp. M1-B02]|uniref:vWA domain-containing protein n=1 Tax=Sphingomonas sp. M1-B02 TaxID=3114300 RepID=UPI0022400068|nr:hypothetical protein [Sphingomonas sp. S6-11]UZK67841.1 hypothetical protein OKW87_08480 [Sphingomonas sp. S6-11]
MGGGASVDWSDQMGMMGVERRQLQVILALDCSGSMRGDRIASLNYALRTALPELRGVAEDNPEVDVRVRVLRFATGASWIFPDALPVADLRWTDLTADGETDMGAALVLLAEALGGAGMTGRQLPPVVVIASDGHPTDDFEAGLAVFFASEHADAAIRIAIAIGTDADLEVLERFIRHPRMKPLRANNATALVEHIKWATTAPVKAASSPTNAPDPLAPLAQSRDQAEPDDSQLIW